MAIFSKTITLENQNTLDYIFLKNGDWQPKNVKNATILQSTSDKVVFNKVISLIKGAEECICLQSFLIQDTEIVDELAKATERGVRVFVTSSAEARLKPNIEEEQDFIKENYKIGFCKKKVQKYYLALISSPSKKGKNGTGKSHSIG